MPRLKSWLAGGYSGSGGGGGSVSGRTTCAVKRTCSPNRDPALQASTPLLMAAAEATAAT